MYGNATSLSVDSYESPMIKSLLGDIDLHYMVIVLFVSIVAAILLPCHRIELITFTVLTTSAMVVGFTFVISFLGITPFHNGVVGVLRYWAANITASFCLCCLILIIKAAVCASTQ